jgi:hypothetical protein
MEGKLRLCKGQGWNGTKQQMQTMVDLLRNEKPIRFGWYEQNPNLFHLMTGEEPVGEGDGVLAENAS